MEEELRTRMKANLEWVWSGDLERMVERAERLFGEFASQSET